MKNNSRFGEVISVLYRGGALGEEPSDDHSTGEPVKIVLGAGQVCPGIEDLLSEMALGEERTVKIASDDAYGRIDPDGIQTYPRAFFPFGHELEIGDVFSWTNPASGLPIPVRVIDAQSDAIVVDFNHPLAGYDLEYWLKVVG
jgi:FKBP-type peptidyl-prolyl cis-trans isomerase 2